jgi:hypothetical protein
MTSRIQMAAAIALTMGAASAATNAAPLVVNFQELAGETFTGVGAYTGDGVADGSVAWNPINTSTGVGSGALTSDGTALVTPISFSSLNEGNNPATPGSGAAFYQPTGNPNPPYTLNSYDPQILLGQGAYGYNMYDFSLTNVPQGTYDLYLYSAVGYYYRFYRSQRNPPNRHLLDRKYRHEFRACKCWGWKLRRVRGHGGFGQYDQWRLHSRSRWPSGIQRLAISPGARAGIVGRPRP